MTLTKYEHACLDIKEGSDRLIIDPGDFANSLNDFSNIVCVVITHVHFDHFNLEKVEAIQADNPEIKIFGTQQVIEKLGSGMSVKAGDTQTIGPFSLRFFGGTHAIIHPSMTPDQNIGVSVSDRLYYAGDSFDSPDSSVDLLAVPAYAPWMKLAEAMDYVTTIKPKRTFQIHDIFLSEAGLQLSEGRIKSSTEQIGGDFTHLDVGQSIEI